MNNKSVLVGMSGGVDSSVAAKLLIDSGYKVAGVTLRLCDNDSDVNQRDAKAICEKMGIEHYNVDLIREFNDYVIADFKEQYKNGKTPNPCIVCNRYIKFGAMIHFADSLGFDYIATGHYAKISNENEHYLIYRAEDKAKDQSYVLYCLNQNQLSRTLLPLGSLNKTEIRNIALKEGFVNANRPDSQDICFVPDGDYAGFIERTDGFISPIGDYVDINGNVLGQHKGIINYTIGQRKGLGIALGKPAFVIDKSVESNNVVLGDEEHLFKKEVLVTDVNFIPFNTLEREMDVTAKLRYRHNPANAKLVSNGNKSIKLIFDEPQRAPSPGQAAVFYSGELVIGGGTIV